MTQQQTTLRTRGIKCEGCVAVARAAVEQLPGVTGTEFDIPGKTVTVTHSDELTRVSVAQALTRAGYPSE